MSEAQKKAHQEKLDKERIAEEEAVAKDICGEIFVKAEWKNFGPHMPPIKSENLFKKPKSAKNRKTEEEMLFK